MIGTRDGVECTLPKYRFFSRWQNTNTTIPRLSNFTNTVCEIRI